MEVLLVFATESEARGTGILPENMQVRKGEILPVFNGKAGLLITGTGMTAMAFHLGRVLSESRFRVVLNAGIAGSLKEEFAPGKVVWVSNDCFADLGAEDHEAFRDLFELGLEDPDEKPFHSGVVQPVLDQVLIPQITGAKGITVNKVHGHLVSIQKIKSSYPGAEIESMEGAAFYFACALSDQPSLQIRAISNYVEPRNREDWKIAEALSALKSVVQLWLKDNGIV
jgi:futalosine hydrolase